MMLFIHCLYGWKIGLLIALVVRVYYILNLTILAKDTRKIKKCKNVESGGNFWKMLKWSCLLPKQQCKQDS